MRDPNTVRDDCLLTLDLDWAPDPLIDHVAALLVSAQVRATWFVTHMSDAVERLRRRPDLFELGLHPNFLENSSHGTTPEAVIEHCVRLVPEASSFRSHSLFQSTPLLALIMERTALRTDVSILLAHCTGLRVAEYRRGTRRLLRAPFFWEDDAEMASAFKRWDVPELISETGLKIFNFHPIHIALNATDLRTYYQDRERLVARANAGSDIERLGMPGAGPRSAFMDLMNHLSVHGGGRHIRDLDVEP